MTTAESIPLQNALAVVRAAAGRTPAHAYLSEKEATALMEELNRLRSALTARDEALREMAGAGRGRDRDWFVNKARDVLGIGNG